MKKNNTYKLTVISVLTALSLILFMIKIPVPLMPPFLTLDFADIPALIGGFALGPVVGVLIVGLKNIIGLLWSSTMGVGELANFLMGSTLVFIASYMYQKDKSRKGAIKGLALGIVAMTIAGAVLNYYILLPFYASLWGLSVESFAEGVNSLVTGINTLIVFGIVPFNILKGTVVSSITILVYKRVSPLIKSVEKREKQGQRKNINA